jgi:hypothetical protein
MALADQEDLKDLSCQVALVVQMALVVQVDLVVLVGLACQKAQVILEDLVVLEVLVDLVDPVGLVGLVDLVNPVVLEDLQSLEKNQANLEFLEVTNCKVYIVIHCFKLCWSVRNFPELFPKLRSVPLS